METVDSEDYIKEVEKWQRKSQVIIKVSGLQHLGTMIVCM